MRTLRPSSVRTYMAAVRNLHVEMGLDYPGGATTLLSRVMRGITRSPSDSRTRLPITTPVLRQLCQCLNESQMRHPTDQSMLHAAFSLAFHGFFRCGELVSLTGLNITVDIQQNQMAVFLPKSKTDPDGQGTTIVVGASSDQNICPVKAMQRYLCHNPTSTMPLFRYYNGGGHGRSSRTPDTAHGPMAKWCCHPLHPGKPQWSIWYSPAARSCSLITIIAGHPPL